MGAGLNVSYTNIEKIEVDGEGGNDTFDVLSTDPDAVTVLEGGSGTNTFNVSGDVTTPVVALNANGTSGVINHSVSSADPDYNGIFAAGVPVSVAGTTAGQVIIGQSAGGNTVEQTAACSTTPLPASCETSYTISLGATRPTDGTIWYVTVAAAAEPAAANPGTSLQVSLDGVTWASAMVLTFDSSSASSWGAIHTVFVRATAGSVSTGDQTVEIMHSLCATAPSSPGTCTAVASSFAGFDDVVISNVEVHVIDGDLPGIITTTPESGLNVIEGSSSVTATYSIRLTEAPAAGETVTVTLTSDDPRLVMPAPLQFTAADWDTDQQVTITATDDGKVEGVRLSRVFSTVTSSLSTGGAYSAGVIDNPTVQVSVYDGDSGGVLVVQPTGKTIVSPTQTATYTIQLTRAPTAPVTVTIITDGKTLVSSSDPRFTATGGLNGMPAVVFAAGDTTPITLTVSVNPNAPAPTGDQPIQEFPAQAHEVSGIYGPLIIEGQSTANRPIIEAVELPTEVDGPLPTPPGSTDTGTPLNTLNVFNDGDPADETGHLGAISAAEFASVSSLYAQIFAATLDISQFGEIDGLGMSGPTTFSHGLATPLTFAGGITYRDIDVVDVMLGTGADNFTVSDTVPDSITMIQGGGGLNTLTATGGGGFNSPLLLMASTTQNGSYYNSTTANITGEARVFTLPTSGHSVLDASQDPFGVIMYGGAGSTFITGGGGGDQIAGGSGPDQIFAGSGNDIIHVNDGFNVDLTHPLSEIVDEDLIGADRDPRSEPDRLADERPAAPDLGHDLRRTGPRHRVPGSRRRRPVQQPDHRDPGRGGRHHDRSGVVRAQRLSRAALTRALVVLAGSGAQRIYRQQHQPGQRRGQERLRVLLAARRLADAPVQGGEHQPGARAATTRSRSATGTTSSSPGPASTRSTAATATRSSWATTARSHGQAAW